MLVILLSVSMPMILFLCSFCPCPLPLTSIEIISCLCDKNQATNWYIFLLIILNIKNYDSTSHVLVGQVQNGFLYVRYRSRSKLSTALEKNAYWHTPCYSIVKATPRVLLTFVKVEKSNVKILILFFLHFVHAYSIKFKVYKLLYELK